MCYRAQFGRSSLKSVVRDTEQPKLESAGAQPLLDGAVADPQNKPLPYISYHVKFGGSVSKGVCINIRKPPKLGSAEAPPI